MQKKRNGLGQFTKDNLDIVIKIPGPITFLRAIFLITILLPWIFIIFYRLNLFEFVRSFMEYVFSPNKNENGSDEKKKGNSFF